MELTDMLNKSLERYNNYKEMNLNLDMSRGKPGSDQLDISEGFLTSVSEKNDCFSENGFDCRNYGILEGIAEARRLMADVMEVSADNVIIGGNSSLNMMFDTIMRDMFFGNIDSKQPWSKLEKVKFICPVPGYDRHFSICQKLGIEMVNVKMTNDGPDMDEVEELIANDNSIKGMWCVPKYSNPDGISYSNEVVRRLATMKAADDFRIMYDNAYVIHHLSETGDGDKLLNIIDECAKAGNPNRIYMYASTSKVTFPGAGISALATSTENINFIKGYMNVQTIGNDKLNQLRHVRFFKDINGVTEHMKKHAEILRPKFENVISILNKEFDGTGFAKWNEPKGGYFISLFTNNNCAKAAIQMAKECGVTFTAAGATYPYGKDPADSNIRIAPTYPSINELITAIEVLCVCIKIVSIKQMLNK